MKETNKKDNNLYLEMAIHNAIEHKKKRKKKKLIKKIWCLVLCLLPIYEYCFPQTPRMSKKQKNREDQAFVK